MAEMGSTVKRYTNEELQNGARYTPEEQAGLSQGSTIAYQRGSGQASPESVAAMIAAQRKGKPAAAASPSAPASAAPSLPLAGLQAAGGGSGAGGGSLGGDGSGAKVIIPPPDLGQTAAADAGGGEAGGYGDAGAGDNLNGPSIFRQGIGTRNLPQYSAILAGLAHVY